MVIVKLLVKEWLGIKMANIDLTVVQFEDLFQGLFLYILGWDVMVPPKTNNVRIGWQREGAPAWKITEDMVFISASPAEEPYNKLHDVEMEDFRTDLRKSVGSTRVMKLDCVIYGPNSMSIAMALKFGMFDQIPREVLSRQRIYFVPNTVEPRRMPEMFQSQWWERVDMSLYFYELIVLESDVNRVNSVEVTMNKEEYGEVGNFEINR